MRMRVLDIYSLPTAMLTTQWASNAIYKMQMVIEHKSSEQVKASIQDILNAINND